MLLSGFVANGYKTLMTVRFLLFVTSVELQLSYWYMMAPGFGCALKDFLRANSSIGRVRRKNQFVQPL
jgi:hypothetical protein